MTPTNQQDEQSKYEMDEQLGTRLYFSKSYAEKIIKISSWIRKDKMRSERMKRRECIGCFYKSELNPRFGGAAITTFKCKLCDGGGVSNNTDTSIICNDCSQKYNRCTYCGSVLYEKDALKIQR